MTPHIFTLNVQKFLFASNVLLLEMYFFSQNYPTAVFLIALQAYELFLLFGKGIDVSKFYTINIPRAVTNHHFIMIRQ